MPKFSSSMAKSTRRFFRVKRRLMAFFSSRDSTCLRAAFDWLSKCANARPPTHVESAVTPMNAKFCQPVNA